MDQPVTSNQGSKREIVGRNLALVRNVVGGLLRLEEIQVRDRKNNEPFKGAWEIRRKFVDLENQLEGIYNGRREATDEEIRKLEEDFEYRKQVETLVGNFISNLAGVREERLKRTRLLDRVTSRNTRVTNKLNEGARPQGDWLYEVEKHLTFAEEETDKFEEILANHSSKLGALRGSHGQLVTFEENQKQVQELKKKQEAQEATERWVEEMMKRGKTPETEELIKEVVMKRR